MQLRFVPKEEDRGEAQAEVELPTCSTLVQPDLTPSGRISTVSANSASFVTGRMFWRLPVLIQWSPAPGAVGGKGGKGGDGGGAGEGGETGGYGGDGGEGG